jgi:hypothetical protein
MRNLLFFFLIALAPAIGCTESMIIIGGDGGGTDAGPGTDSGPRVDVGQFDAGPGIACGANTCREDDFCCNASCGVCVAPGGTCTEEACGEPVVCDGNVCADTAMCCAACPGEPSICSDASGSCPDVSCPGLVCGGEVCGADSLSCCAGCDDDVICGGPRGECPDLDCPVGPCFAQDVRFEGGCEPAHRYWWNGSSCVGDAGCECVGADCSETFGDQATCEAAFATCGMPPGDCDVDDARGEGDCRPLFGYAWNGFSCNPVTGCECIGGDCDSLPAGQAECDAVHDSCGPPPTCESDRECGAGGYCDSCARGSCEVCEDCVSGCRPHSCEGDGPVTCDELAPECGEQGVAIVYEGCWACVNARSCERLDEPEI